MDNPKPQFTGTNNVSCTRATRDHVRILFKPDFALIFEFMRRICGWDVSCNERSTVHLERPENWRCNGIGWIPQHISVLGTVFRFGWTDVKSLRNVVAFDLMRIKLWLLCESFHQRTLPSSFERERTTSIVVPPAYEIWKSVRQWRCMMIRLFVGFDLIFTRTILFILRDSPFSHYFISFSQ